MNYDRTIDDTETFADRSSHVRRARTTPDSAADRPQARAKSAPGTRLADQRVRQTCLTILSMVDVPAPASAETLSARQLLDYVTSQYNGVEPTKFDQLCRGLGQLADDRPRQALTDFEQVLEGQVDEQFEALREVALNTDALCLERLDYDDDALEQFTRLLYRKFNESRGPQQPDHIADLLGLGR